ncbi:MAG: hypothetical protein KFF72_10390 [Arthrospira sp. SH-MAG29]|nr:hypothetical protein [Arthrospira sp. SH-MAG29]MBS0016748.1 hypothetical protein [Arthrospira sp. SH-MAG29]
MVRYTLPQSPEILLSVRGKDSPKAREQAMDKLMELMDNGKLPTELEDGFSPEQFVEVKETSMATVGEEDAITEAVQTLSNLASLKLKMMESREEALKARDQIDILFSDQSTTMEEITDLKEGFKALKNFAVANLRYREARNHAEAARMVLDEALKSSDSHSPPPTDTPNDKKKN